MAFVEIQLKDKNNNVAGLGSTVKLFSPRKQFINKKGKLIYFKPKTTLIGKIYCLPSKGLQLKILEILEREAIPNNVTIDELQILRVGDRIKFNYTLPNWEIITPEYNNLEFDLFDTYALSVQIGDIIEICLPEMEILYSEKFNTSIIYSREKIIAKAQICFWKSKGLMLKILEVIAIATLDSDYNLTKLNKKFKNKFIHFSRNSDKIIWERLILNAK